VARAQWIFKDETAVAATRPALQIRLLGTPTVLRDGQAIAMPASRKLRALLALLLSSPGPVHRSRLCELLWERPSDPRGELRWCLSKLRGIVDDARRKRIHTSGDAIGFDASDCDVDTSQLERASARDLSMLSPSARRHVAMRQAGDFLEGLAIGRCPQFEAWLAWQRRRYRRMHAELLHALARSASDEESLGYVERWLHIEPFEPQAHALLLAALVRVHRVREAKEHVDVATRMFEAEGIDTRALREAWRSARSGTGALREPLELVA
jgi:DNA-binding SARP family transcriptional activator